MSWQKLSEHQGVATPVGFTAAGVQANIKYPGKYDVALICSDCPAAAAGVFTKNLVKAHPLKLSQKHLANGQAQAIVVNSGNANACLGEEGDRGALTMAEETAQALGIDPEDVLVASTGVIGSRFPTERVCAGIRRAAAEAPSRGAHCAALAIMTTDLVPKEAAYELQLSQGVIHLGIMAKGSGMIHPNMGTMLGFITTDARVEPEKLQGLLREAVDESFNMVTVDGDTSTNDMVIVLANGRSHIEPKGEEWTEFCVLFREACQNMARAIAADGEGASKLMTVSVEGARDKEQARQVARAVCGSSLVKCALYGRDANWGRIICAVGYAGAEVDPQFISIYLNGLQVASKGQEVAFDERKATQLLSEDNVTIHIDLVDGKNEQGFAATAWGCDLTHKYIDINADYRS